MTCLCNQTFMVAESLVSPVYFSSFASSFRAARLLSRSSAFIRSTMEVRQASFSPFAAAALSTIAATSTVCAGGTFAGVALGDDDDGDDDEAPDVGAVPGVGEALAACAEPCPKIAPIIFPKTVINFLPSVCD